MQQHLRKTIFYLLLTICGSAVQAQVEGDTTVLSYDTTLMLDELVISANKIPETKDRISQQVVVIEQKDIAVLNAQTTAEVVANSGVVAMQRSQQGGGSPQLRGFEANRVLLVVDGVRMNNLIYRGGHLQNILSVDNNSLERVEILMGPSSTVYGSDALGGVIHLQTKAVTLSTDDRPGFKVNAMARFGSINNEKTGHVDLHVAGPRFGSFTSITATDLGDLTMGKTVNPSYGKEFGVREYYVVRSPDNSQDLLIENEDKYVQRFSGYTQLDFVQKFLFKASSQVEHLLNFQFSTTSDIPRYDRLTDPDGNGGLRTAEWYYGPQKRLMTAYTLRVRNVGAFADAISTTVSYQDVRESRHDRRFNRSEKRNQFENVNVLGLIIDLNKEFNRHSVRYGFDGQWNTLKSTAYNENIQTGERSGVATRYPDGHNAMNSYGLYLTHTYDVRKNLSFNDGVRFGVTTLNSSFVDKEFFPFPFDDVKQQNEYLSASAGLTYRPNTWKLSFSVGTGYRVANVDDLGKVFDTSAGESLIVPNPDIDPEKTLTFDLGMNKRIGERLQWENNGFYTFFYDAIVLADFTYNGQSTIIYQGEPTRVLANQNQRKAYLTGFNSALHYDLSPRFSFDASVNYTYGRIRTDSVDMPLDHIPPFFGRARITYNHKKIQAQVFSNFSGWKRIDDYLMNSEDNEAYATPQGMPSWHTVNLRFGVSLSSRWTIQAGVDNLMDLQYRTFSSGINGPGRNFFSTVRFSL